MKIYNLGSLNIDYVYNVDHFVTPGETLSSEKMEVFPGGKGLNQSIALAKAGADVIHGAIVGNDGAFLVETMKNAGVNTDSIKTMQNTSGHAIIQVDASGQNCILLFAGTNNMITRDYVESFLSTARKDDILLLQNEVNGLEMIFEIAEQKQMQIAFNPSPFDEKILDLPLEKVKWWFCNEIEAKAIFGEETVEKQADVFIKKYKDSNLILTLGKDGCIFKNSREEIFQPIFEAKTVDTTAAGDTFTGYFLANIVKGNDIATSLKIASKAASIAVSKKGASTSIPLSKEVIIE